ncbi:hypothetical protein KC622_01750, partial [Candidatus Dojkabacteria bacterium]|nr:hypothetical protein [Candidatus Dojkabacteria bacterium]
MEDSGFSLKGLFKKVIFWSIIGLFVYYVVIHFGDIENIAKVLHRGNWKILLIAGVLQLLAFIFVGDIFKIL